MRGLGEISRQRAKYKLITILLSSFSASNIPIWFGIEGPNPKIPRFWVSPSKSLYKWPSGWHDRMGCRKSQDGSIGIGISISDASMWYLNDFNPEKSSAPHRGIYLRAEVRNREQGSQYGLQAIRTISCKNFPPCFLKERNKGGGVFTNECFPRFN